MKLEYIIDFKHTDLDSIKALDAFVEATVTALGGTLELTILSTDEYYSAKNRVLEDWKAKQ